MTARLKRWQENVVRPNASELFLRTFYLFWLLNLIRLLPVANSIWGSEAPIILNQMHSGFAALTMLLNDPPIRDYYWLFLLPLMSILLLGVCGLHNIVSRASAWFLFACIQFGNAEINNGGFHLSQQLFFFSTFFVGAVGSEKNRFSRFRNLVHNLAHYAIWIQIAIMYGMAGLQKLRGDLWLSGDAVAIILSLEEYSLPFINELISGNNLLLRLMTYAALAYQLSFPCFIWFRKMRPIWLMFGTGFHLFIAVVIGISDYGFILIASYSIFIEEERAKAIVMRLKMIFAGKWQAQRS